MFTVDVKQSNNNNPLHTGLKTKILKCLYVQSSLGLTVGQHFLMHTLLSKNGPLKLKDGRVCYANRIS